jgi:hypothetical protein
MIRSIVGTPAPISPACSLAVAPTPLDILLARSGGHPRTDTAGGGGEGLLVETISITAVGKKKGGVGDNTASAPHECFLLHTPSPLPLIHDSSRITPHTTPRCLSPPPHISMPVQQRQKHCCLVCHHAFSKAEHLMRHSRTHSEERPFTCPACGKSFARQYHEPTIYRSQPPSEC